MTPASIMGIALDRVGLTITNGIFKDRAREYLNIVGDRVFARTRWQWLLKSTTLTTVSTQRSYSLAADVLEVLSFRDTTHDRPMQLVDQAWIDARDADANETGDPEAVALSGINATTGYWTVDLFPTPDGTGTVTYRYYAQWVTLTAADDDTDLRPRMPALLQPALAHGVAGLYYEEKGDLESATREQERYEEVLNRAMERNAHAQGMRSDRLQRVGGNWGFDFAVQEGSLH